MMSKKITVLLTALLVAMPVLADKPEWAGSGKPPSREQIEEHRDEMREKRGNQGESDQSAKPSKKSHKDKGKGSKDKASSANGASDELQRDIQRSSEMADEVKEMGRKWWQIWQ